MQTMIAAQPSSTASPPPTHGAVERALELATSLAKSMLERMLLQTVESLHARESAAQDMMVRIQFADAVRALQGQQSMLLDRFPELLRDGLRAATHQVSTVSAQPGHLATLRFDQLELMNDEQMQAKVEIARALQNSMQVCEHELTELDALMCAALGLARVQSERNPLRPHSYVMALDAALALATEHAAQRVLWMQSLGAALGKQLREVYREISAFLKLQHIQAASYALQTSPNVVAVRTTAPRVTVDQLRHVLSGERMLAATGAVADSGAGADTAKASAFTYVASGAGTPSALQHIGTEELARDLEQIGELVRRISDTQIHVMQTGGILAADALGMEVAHIDSNASDMLSQFFKTLPSISHDSIASQQNEEEVAQEVVRMLLDNLQSDQRMLPAIRRCISSLELPLVQLAKVDAHFLAEKTHPARVLLDEITARSMGFYSEKAEGFTEFFAPIERALALLHDKSIENAQPFVSAWQAIQNAWVEHQKASAQAREHAVHALLQVEQRNVLAEKIARELTRRDDAALAPAYVKQFLAGPWSQVLAKVRLASDKTPQDAQAMLAPITDLLWSVVPSLASKNKPRLVRMIPALLTQLRHGLASVQSPAAHHAAFFDQLMQSHEAALKATVIKASIVIPTPPAYAPEVSETLPLANARQIMEQEFEEADESIPWLAPQEAQDSGFMSDYPQSLPADSQPPGMQPSPQAGRDDMAKMHPQARAEAPVPVQHPTPATALVQAQAPTQQPATSLPMGDLVPPVLASWVDLYSDGRWVRAQLTWASPHGTLYMFTGASGRPYSMTRRALDKMLAAQTLRVVMQDSMVVGALDAVAQTALRNTIEAKP